ncbi:MAG: pyridoxal phosphate-dependent aminotransferase [Deltaproteobacteria bacterium]|nr:pyridoxal phosphate-dependent aminotransferase [Deltaproteobacteria bacterium]
MPRSIVAESVAHRLRHASWIRRMFEEGNRLRAERGAENVFDFSLGNPEVEPPELVLAAVRKIVSGQRPRAHAYMPNGGFPEVRQALAQRQAQATGLPFAAENIILTVGAGGALNVVLKALLDPGDEVIALAPCFVEYRSYVENHGGRLVVAETRADFQPYLSRVAQAITPRTKAILINSPNNPTGVVYPAQFLDGLEALLQQQERPVVVISDEPYRALAYDGIAIPETQRHLRNAIVATSWSKTLAIPGERIGMLAISPRIEEAHLLGDACTCTNRILGFVNAPALWQWVVAEVGHHAIDIAPYQAKRDLFWEGLTRMGYRCVRPQGAFYLFPETPLEDDVGFVQLLLEEGILAVPGSGFGRSGHMRLSMTVSRSTIERSLPGFERALARARSRQEGGERRDDPSRRIA